MIIYRQDAIDTEGLEEEIRCEMCKNPMHTDRGCDGYCKYDEELYKRIMQILNKRITPLPSAQPEIIRCKDCMHNGSFDTDCPIYLAQMSRLDDTITSVAYILDTLMTYRNIVDSGDCNRCGKKKTCKYAPKPGQLVRYNCPFYKQEGE